MATTQDTANEKAQMQQPLQGTASQVRAALQAQIQRLQSRTRAVRDLQMFDDEPSPREIEVANRRAQMVGEFQEQVLIRQRILDAMDRAQAAGADAVRAGEQARLAALDQQRLAGERLADGEARRLLQSSGLVRGFDQGALAAAARRELPVLTRDPLNLVAHPNFLAEFNAFSGAVPKGSPPTPDRLQPDVLFNREFRTAKLLMPDGNEVEFWGFVDPDGPLKDGAYPSELIRIPEHRLFHCRMKPRKGTHTIHWHGIEPTAMNDGVGKLSFEVTGGGYTYQWFSAAAGTYFYHCHHNTALHFEMGMVGLLIIDPLRPEGLVGPDAPYPQGGPGCVQRGNEVIPYDVEAMWFIDDVDPRWHEMSHDEGLGLPFGEDAGQNRWEPKYFLISGRPHPWSRNLPTDSRPGVAATVRVGQTLLARVVCGAYALTRNTLHGLDAEVIAEDGRALGKGVFGQYSQPYPLPAGTPFELTPARRWDLLIRPTAGQVGDHVFRTEFIHYSSGRLMGVAETLVHVVP